MADEALALAYIDGNNRAFDELLARYQSHVFSYIIYIVKDEDLANELFQETFLRVITKMQGGQYRVVGKFSWWLTRIAHNVVIDHYRQLKSNRQLELSKDIDLSLLTIDAVQGDSREQELTRQQVFQDVTHLMEALPAAQCEVVRMRFFENLSFKEIAEKTGVSINTSLGRMRYALINMRRMTRQHQVSLDCE